jgi:hypothetical protein
MSALSMQRAVQNPVVEGNGDLSINALNLLIGSRPAPVQDVAQLGIRTLSRPTDQFFAFGRSLPQVLALHQSQHGPASCIIPSCATRSWVRASAGATHKSRERVHERLPERRPEKSQGLAVDQESKILRTQRRLDWRGWFDQGR